MSLDPAALQVLIARLSGVAAETGAVLQRAAFSPNIKERADCSAAVFDPSGRLLAQAEHIPVHLGSMPASVAAVIARFDGVGDPVAPGEQAVVNDPYEGGTHLNDVTVVAPCHVDGRLIGWVANRAHHADLGGRSTRFATRRRDRHRAGGAAHPAGAVDARGARADRRVVPDARRTGRGSRRPGGRERRRGQAPGRAGR